MRDAIPSFVSSQGRRESRDRSDKETEGTKGFEFIIHHWHCASLMSLKSLVSLNPCALSGLGDTPSVNNTGTKLAPPLAPNWCPNKSLKRKKKALRAIVFLCMTVYGVTFCTPSFVASIAR